MSSYPENSAIVERMRGHLATQLAKGASAQLPPCDGGFTFSIFSVTYPNAELIVNVVISGAPAEVTLLGMTVVATPSAGSGVTYCMGVAADNQGLPLPMSLLAASTLPTFAGPTVVSGMAILSYSVAGAPPVECSASQSFTVGG